MKKLIFSLFTAFIATTALWASNVITYTATEKLPEVTTDGWGTGLHINAFNVAITSHEFSNGIGTITFAGEVTTIGKQAFYFCSDLTSVTIGNSVTTIGDYAFSDCRGLTSVTIGNSVTTIGEGAFSYCSDLTSITIPNSVTTIGSSAFEGCSGLTFVTIGNSVTTIGEDAFVWCEGLTSVTIGNSVTTIGSSAFEGCSGLTSVTIPNSVTTIGEGAFYQCHGLTSVTIPNSVTTIGGWAFANCSSLTSINVDINNTHYCSIDGVLFSYAKDSLIQYPKGNTRTEYSIPNSVTTIGEDAFDFCDGLKSVIIPNSVTTIGDYAFNWCEGLTSITIPNSVTTIGDYAFYYCRGLTSVTIGNSVTAIGKSAFGECSGLTFITCFAQDPPRCGDNCFKNVPKDIPLYLPYYVSIGSYKSAEGWKDFTNIIPMCFDVCGEDLHWKYKDGTLSISGTGDMYDFTQTDSPWLDLKDSVTNIVLPSNITSIGNYAFYSFSKLTSITIPNSVTTIGESAFENCTYLAYVTLGSNLSNIGCNAFKGDFRLEEITIFAEYTPNVCSTTFEGVSKQYVYLYVPEKSIRKYQVDPNWNVFDIRTKAAEVTPIDSDKPIVEPTDQDVTITWPITDGADTYTLTITKNGETVCVLTFNANGQLTNIAFAAPGHNGAHQAPAATLTAQGYQFTVTGLNPGTAYDYSVTATDAGGQTLAEHKGNFSTTGGATTSMDKVHDAQCTMHKVLRNGQLLIETNNATYTPMGQKVR